MYRVNVVLDTDQEFMYAFKTENQAAAFMVRCEEFENVISTKMLRPAKDSL
jgi:hypothetical protein